MADYRAAIDRAERAILARYNVQSLSALGPLADAVAAARAGDIGTLEDAMDGRNMYRWQAEIDEALAEAKESPAPVADASNEAAAEAPAEDGGVAKDGTTSETPAPLPVEDRPRRRRR